MNRHTIYIRQCRPACDTELTTLVTDQSVFLSYKQCVDFTDIINTRRRKFGQSGVGCAMSVQAVC